MTDYFAGGNTGAGFVNCLPDALCGIKRVWILRGTPGCGKSSFLKKLVAEALSRSMAVERIFCSSDSSSLDGVVLRELSFAAVDGTPPHTTEAVYPLAVQTEIDLARFMRRDIVEASADRVKELTDRKKRLFSSAYDFLAADTSLKNAAGAATAPFFLREKLRAFIGRSVSRLKRREGKTIYRQTQAFTRWGREEIPFGLPPERIRVLDDGESGLRSLFFELLAESTAGQERIICRDCTDFSRIASIFFPVDGTLFTAGKCAHGNKRINSERFISRDGLKESAHLRRAVNKQRKALQSNASLLLSSAFERHRELEGIYIRASDFAALEEYESKLIKELFG